MIRFCLITNNDALGAAILSDGKSIMGFEFVGVFGPQLSFPDVDIILSDEKMPFSLEKTRLPIFQVNLTPDGLISYAIPGKGFQEFQLNDLLHFALSHIPFYPRTFLFDFHTETYILNNTELAFIAADRHSVDIYFIDGRKLTLFQHLGWFELRLPLPFFRVHRSYMVNASVIYRIQKRKKKLWLRPKGMHVPYSETYAYQIALIEKWLDGRRILF